MSVPEATRGGGSYTALGYRSAQVMRRSGRAMPRGGSSDSHLRRDRDLLARMGDQLLRDNAIFNSVTGLFVKGVLGPKGFRLNARTGDTDLDARIEADWKEFSKAPEVRGIHTFRELEKLALLSVLTEGDLGIVATNSRQFQYVESHRICGGRRASEATRNGGKIEEGVELDRFDRPKAFWIAPYDRQGFVRKAKARRIKERDFIFVAHRKRLSQTRGVPVLTPVYSLIHRINDVMDSEAIAWQQMSRFSVSITRNGGGDLGYLGSSADGDGVASPPDLADRYVELEEGTIFMGEPGEEVKGIERNLPGSAFGESIRMFLRLIGVPLGLPLELLLLDWSNTNYSSSRSSLEQAYLTFRSWQDFLKQKHHTPLYERWLAWQIADGRYPDTADTLKHTWAAPEFPWVDLKSEAEGWGIRLDRSLALHGDALKSLNLDPDEFREAQKKETLGFMELAEEINKEAPEGAEPVTWRELSGSEVGKTEAAVNAAAAEAPESAPKSMELEADPEAAALLGQRSRGFFKTNGARA